MFCRFSTITLAVSIGVGAIPIQSRWNSADSCQNNESGSTSIDKAALQEPTDTWRLQYFGTMREAIGMGQNQGRVTLGQLAEQPDFYGVGALAGLRGEITIHDSQVVVSTVNRDGELVTANSRDVAAMQATLLIGSQVSAWTEIEVTQSIKPNELDRYLAGIAQQRGIDTEQPFPFVIEGDFLDVHVHVISGACPIHSRRNNAVIPDSQRPFEMQADKLPGRVVGIFAANAAGRVTHPGSSVHAHLLFDSEAKQLATGHLEKFGVHAGAIVKVPQGLRHNDK